MPDHGIDPVAVPDNESTNYQNIDCAEQNDQSRFLHEKGCLLFMEKKDFFYSTVLNTNDAKRLIPRINL
jgi:hypothetical protein